MRVEITIKKIVDTETDMVPCYLMSAITMNFDGESIVFDDLGAATPLIFLTAALLELPMPTMSQMHALSHRQILWRYA